MSRPNRNKKIIDLSNNESDSRCTSSASSSNSDDGDSIKNISESSPSLKIPNRTAFASNGHGAFKGGSEAPSTDRFREYPATVDLNEKQIMSIVNSNENLTSTACDSQHPMDRLHQKEAADHGAMDNISIRPEMKGVYHYRMRSGKIFELSEEQLQELQCRGLKVPEWRSLSKPVVNDRIVNGKASTFALKRDAAEYSQLEPKAKKQKDLSATARPDGKFQYGSGTENAKKSRLNGTADQWTRFLRKLMKEPDIPGQSVLCRTKVGELKPAISTTRAITATTTTAAITVRATNENEDQRKLTLRTAEDAALSQDDSEYANLLLGDNSVTAVLNNGTDSSATDGNDDTLNSSSNEDNDSKAKKKNRCVLCRKKVGLTGFECRCGGLYCGIHRYSDKHNCTFDYRQLGAQEIRRNNPVVIGEKIQKI